MSRIPGPGPGPYGPYPPLPRGYFYDQEGPEFQESDLDQLNAEPSYACYPELDPNLIPNGHLNPDMNEMYRRKYAAIQGQLPPNPQSHFFYPHAVPMPMGPMYRRLPIPRVVQNRSVSPSQFYGPLPIGHPEEGLQRTPHHHHNQPIWADYYQARPNTAHLERPEATSVKSKNKGSKPPVSVRTPRFYRRLTSQDMYRRMSALCLPMACQADPAKRASKVHHRSSEKKHHHRNVEGCEKNLKNTKTRTFVTPKIKNSESDVLPVIETVERCGDFEMSNKPSKMKDIFQRYQKVFDKCTLTDENDNDNRNDNDIDNDSVKSQMSKVSKCQKSVKSKNVKKISPHLLKPKLPPSLLIRRKKRTNSQKTRTSSDSSNLEIFENEPKLEIEPMTTEQLDKMLVEMRGQSGESSPREKFKNSIENQKNQEIPEINLKNENLENENSKKNLPASLNYAELTKLMEQHGIGSEAEIGEGCQNRAVSSSNIPTSHTSIAQNSRPGTRQKNRYENNCTNLQRFEKLSEISTPVNCSTRSKRSPWTTSSGAAGDQNENLNQNRPKTAQTNAYQSVDDHSAIEIHQSKSYIVNLIDRALSREFRTLPEANSKPFMDSSQISPKNSISIVTKNPNTTITVLPNSQCCNNCSNNNSNNLQSTSQGGSISHHHLEQKEDYQSGNPESNREDMLSTGDETLCIKQLKKLRYGHLKHIQREMRKLEHLERFIDSYTTENTP